MPQHGNRRGSHCGNKLGCPAADKGPNQPMSSRTRNRPRALIPIFPTMGEAILRKTASCALISITGTVVTPPPCLIRIACMSGPGIHGPIRNFR